MPSNIIVVNGSVGAAAIAAQITKSADAAIGLDPTLTAAKSGSLSTRTNNTDGTVTLGGGHGITTGNTVDLFWTGGRRFNVVVGTVAGNDVPISGGSGDNLPAQATAVLMSKQQVLDVDFVGNNVVAYAITSKKRARVQLYDGATLRQGLDLDSATPFLWYEGHSTNPLAGFTISSITATCGEAAACDLSVGVLYNP